MLERLVIPTIRSNGAQRTAIFQQDGARAHTSCEKLAFLKQYFPGRLISNRTEFQWPPRSPDLSPLDFWSWGHLRNSVYANPRPRTTAELKTKLLKCYEEIPRFMFRHAVLSAQKRAHLCLEAKGKHFENIH